MSRALVGTLHVGGFLIWRFRWTSWRKHLENERWLSQSYQEEEIRERNERVLRLGTPGRSCFCWVPTFFPERNAGPGLIYQGEVVCDRLRGRRSSSSEAVVCFLSPEWLCDPTEGVSGPSVLSWMKWGLLSACQCLSSEALWNYF